MTNNYSRSGTKKRQPKKVQGKTTLKYGGGKKADWVKRHFVPRQLAKILGWQKSVELSHLAQEEQHQTLPERYSNMEPSPIPTDDSEEERAELARKHIAAQQTNTGPSTTAQIPATLSGENDKKPYAEIENIGAANTVHKTPPSTTDKGLGVDQNDWINRQHISPQALNPNALYITTAHIRKMKDAKKQTKQVLSNFKFPSPPKMPPTLPPKLSMKQLSNSSEHIYDVLPPKMPPILPPKLPMKQLSHSSEHIYDVLPPKMPEKLERLPRRNSLKKTKPSVIKNWEAAMAAAQKQPSPGTRKSTPPRQKVRALANMFETSK